MTFATSWWTGEKSVSCLKGLKFEEFEGFQRQRANLNLNEEQMSVYLIKENTFIYFVQWKICLKDKYSTNIPYYKKHRVRRRYFYFFSVKQAEIGS